MSQTQLIRRSNSMTKYGSIPSIVPEKEGQEDECERGKKKNGLSFGMTSFFLVSQMAGAGFLTLPRAFADSGWLGLPMMVLFCGSVTFSATRLGKCWVLLEERWLQYREDCRQPYMEIAYRALGNWGR
ncbi:unnamed protein product [Meganyctiphanes norvegica]|uniref:Amino acid transporter transmembrane domain-containing protein n=1 Tax=Meganyctiphanes norvegica TaxID=48144 RepID=A0AAV2RC25_MEGNR